MESPPPPDATDEQVPKLVWAAKVGLRKANKAARERFGEEKERKAEDKAKSKEARADQMTKSADKIAVAAHCIQSAPAAAAKGACP